MIVIGCCNGKPGLLFLGDKDTPNFVHKLDTRGTCYVPERNAVYFLTRGGLSRWQLDDDREPQHLLGPNQIAEGARDWHGLIYHGGSLWATDPVEDIIFEFSLDGHVLGSYHWKPEGEGRLHTNDIFFDGADMYLSCFNWGIVKNAQMQELGKNCQPHSPIIYDGRLYFCASNKGEVHDQQGDVFCAPGGFTRGLLATDEGLWVGSSAERHGCGGNTARIQLYDWGGVVKKTVPLPTNEVYSITTTEMGAAHVGP
jgi:hypothetical protein